MATPQLSPGVIVREVDLTVGRADNVLDNIGVIAGPFSLGPVNEAIDITTEQDLLNVFGKPLSTDNQYEYWMSASSYLSYGGVLKVVRVDGNTLSNANAIRNSLGVSTAGSPDLKIKNFDDYEANYADDIANYIFAAKTPGSWSNSLKVCVIDDKADQILGVGTQFASAAEVGMGVTTPLTNVTSAGIGTTSIFNGYLKAIITGVGTNTVDVKINSIVSTSNVETLVTYAQQSPITSFKPVTSGNPLTVNLITTAGSAVTSSTIITGSNPILDWYDQQTLNLSTSLIYWSSLAPKPKSSKHALERNSKNDEIHVVIIDDNGSVTGIQGNLLERHIGLSKASDAVSAVNSPQKIWWKNYIATYSNYVYVGDNPSDNSNPNERVSATGFSTSFVGVTTAEGLWNTEARDKTYSALGNVVYTLAGGRDYSASKGMVAKLGDLFTAYNLFSNPDEIQVDYLIMGPGMGNKYESQAKANHLISIANGRKDCIAVISPHRADVVDVTNTDKQTDNIIEFFSGGGLNGSLASSSYAVFDSGYKYTYDRFNNKFRYVPCNPDIAGLMVRTSIVAYPWFSPAGQQRGILNNAIKLAYNPSRAQRDQLYPLRINSIVNQPGVGILLFGDKTALGYASAFDRINVRRLFLTIEQALQKSAQAQLFELNDEITRANFRNIVEPYLRDVEAKRGLYGFLVVCDETNNTPDIIDNNEFRADIYLKPAKAINYVTLTFVATRTGISFEEVAGTV
jgi:hypothetical protein